MKKSVKDESRRKSASKTRRLSPYVYRDYGLGVIREVPGKSGVGEMDISTVVSLGTATQGARVTYNPTSLLAAFSGTPLTRMLDAVTGIYTRWQVVKVALAPNVLNVCPSMAYGLLPAGAVVTPGALNDVIHIRDSAIYLNSAQASALTTGSVWGTRKDLTVSLDLTGTDEIWLDNNTAVSTPNLFSAVRFTTSAATDSCILMIRVRLKGFNTL